jgi:hypothetical protein
LLWELVFVAAGEAGGVVVDGGAGVADEEDSAFGFGDADEGVFWVVLYDSFWEVLVGGVEL